MRPMLLVGGNFLRENRWAVLVLMVWVLGSGAAAALSVAASAEDALFFLKQQCVYSVVFIAFLAASALYNQRRSRRILAVLSKGIGRSQYLAGVACGYLCVAVFYCLAMGITGAWTFSAAHANPAGIWPLVMMLLAASTLSGTVALFFSTFLSPLFTVIATGLVLGTTGAAAHLAGRAQEVALPAFTLINAIMNMSFEHGWHTEWRATGYAVLESLVFWVVASLIFSRRDIAVPVE